MTWSLLRMLEWQARSTHGWGYDTWHAGKFVAEWADPAVYTQLQDCFAGLDAAECWRAFGARVTLFQHLARQVAASLGFSYPAELEEQITACLEALSGSCTNPSAA
jgi:aminoglycoside 6-adenylyltransferase